MIVAALICDWRRQAPVRVEMCGTVERCPTADNITNVLKIESDCRPGSIAGCENRGEQNGTNDTADAADCDTCGEQGKSFLTKTEREVLEVHVSRIMWRTRPLSGMGRRWWQSHKSSTLRGSSLSQL